MFEDIGQAITGFTALFLMTLPVSHYFRTKEGPLWFTFTSIALWFFGITGLFWSGAPGYQVAGVAMLAGIMAGFIFHRYRIIRGQIKKRLP